LGNTPSCFGTHLPQAPASPVPCGRPARRTQAGACRRPVAKGDLRDEQSPKIRLTSPSEKAIFRAMREPRVSIRRVWSRQLSVRCNHREFQFPLLVPTLRGVLPKPQWPGFLVWSPAFRRSSAFRGPLPRPKDPLKGGLRTKTPANRGLGNTALCLGTFAVRRILDAPASSYSSLRSRVWTQCLGRSGFSPARPYAPAWGRDV
jgi:hypothetical protein